MMKKSILVLSLFCITVFAVDAETVAALKQLCAPGGKMVLEQDVIVEGVVVSDYHSQNMDLNPSVTANRLDYFRSDATAYIQDYDGSCGVRVVFKESADNRLRRADRVRINAKGCILERMANPDCITLSGLTWLSVDASVPGSEEDIVKKEKFVSELADEDLYTFVSLKELEFVFKSGSYADINEKHAAFCPAIHSGVCEATGRMDGWASLLRDGQGSCIYMLVNMLCEWRRNGKGVPQGIGNVEGIIVHTPMRRYGGDMGAYSIRPLDESGIKISRKRASNWKRLTAWVQDGTTGQTLTFEMLGEQSGLWQNGRKGDRVLSEDGPGKGFLWTDSDAYIHVGTDFNSLTAEKEGGVPNGAIVFKGTGTGWYTFDENGKAQPDAKSFFVEVDARKAKGSMMTFNFSWLAGTGSPEDNWGFPAQWKVQYSLDGNLWQTLKEIATGAEIINLRAHPWMDKKIERLGGMRRTGFDTALGMQQRSFHIPIEAFGKRNVLLRITPANSIYYSHRVDPKTSVVDPQKTMKGNMSYTASIIRFGEISIDYR